MAVRLTKKDKVIMKELEYTPEVMLINIEKINMMLLHQILKLLKLKDLQKLYLKIEQKDL